MTMTANSQNSAIAQEYYQPAQMDLDSWWKIASIDYEKLIETYQFEELFKSFSKPEIKLLDVGCGWSKFPSLLDTEIKGDVCCRVDLFDISEYCLQQSVDTLDKLDHFIPNKKYLSSLENIHSSFDQNRQHYDLIWSIHSLSTVDKSQMKTVFECFMDLLESNGKLLIYQNSQQSFYYNVWDFYIKNYPSSDVPELTTIEDTINILDLLNISYETIPIHFEHVISKQDQSLLEMYLKRVILNKEVDVLNLFQNKLGEYYEQEQDRYVFPQQVDFIIVNKKK